MTTYFMFGNYSKDAMERISSQRTEQVKKIIQSLGGKVHAMYALLGDIDVVLIVEFPSMDECIKASISLTKLTDIAFSTSPAISMEQFDKITSS